MPLDAWILLLFSVGLGLGLELAFMAARRRSGYAVEPSSRHEDERRAAVGGAAELPDRPEVAVEAAAAPPGAGGPLILILSEPVFIHQRRRIFCLPALPEGSGKV